MTQLLRMSDGLILHQSLYVAAKLGIADMLKDGARPSTELAIHLQVNEDAIYRLLRFLAGEGIFCETAPGVFANTTLSDLLRSDVPQSLRSLLTFRGGSYFLSSLAGLCSSIKTGMPGCEELLGIGSFEYLRRHPREGRIFDEAMTSISALCASDVAAAYDFGKWKSLMDVGGGNGRQLAAILEVHRELRGVLADQPDVLRLARHRGIFPAEIAARVEFETADFFAAVPSGCRAYLMKNILHDWDDERAHRILLNCRRALPDDGVLLLVEYCLGEVNQRSRGKAVDIAMLAVTGGRERTASEHRKLLAGAAFRMNRIITVNEEMMMIEATPV